ncbi:MAG: DUF4922 domain-containing protein [Bacteroidetes bacterium]|nr:MAG: DUF4922 domain-containing protein [Bacteroidota bacterium]
MSFEDKALALLERQKSNWPLLRTNWGHLDAAHLKRFDFGGFSIQVQFNPERIRSSAARVDKKSIEKRACFLCDENRPAEQEGLAFGDEFSVLCNPFPIFRSHFTISARSHRPQLIEGEFGTMLELSRSLPGFVVFYNAPSCGASAPDHMHFQAGNRGFMPIEDELEELRKRYGSLLSSATNCRMTAIDDSLRRFILLEGSNARTLTTAFEPLSAWMRKRNGGEPMLNILAMYSKQWQVLVFPRGLHRPWQFFAEGEDNILLSPASVDMGGMLITPMEKDFKKITATDIVDIFSQVSLDPEGFEALLAHLNASNL